MFPYIIAFCITIIATYNAQKCKSKGVLFFVHFCFAICPLTILAAVRDPQIGTDTYNYMHLFTNAVDYNNNLPLYILLHPSFEIGFLCYNFLVAQIVSTVESYYIITYSLILGFALFSAIKLKEYIKPHIFMMVYLLLFFSDSLNIMRQYIAVSIIFFATTHLFTHKYIKYILWTTVACFFHTSAIISFVFFGVYWFTRKYSIHNHRFLYIILCVAAFVVAVGLGYFANIGLLPTFEEKLANHLNNSTGSGVSNSYIVVCLCTLMCMFAFPNKTSKYNMMLLLACFTMIFYISPAMNSVLYRITIYFNTISCFSVAYIYKNASQKFRVYVKGLLFLYFCFYIFSIVLSGTGEVVPYSSKILGI